MPTRTQAVRSVPAPSEAVAELLRRTRTERGLPDRIENPEAIAKVAAIVAAGGGADRGAA